MRTTLFQAAASALLFVSAAQGHMIMKSPKPFNVVDNSPLGPGDFPCKAASTYDRTDANANIMAIGEPQTLSFTGSAVHGGGSCQVSLTTDLHPTKDSKWMVIKSIEGGCPASVAGNLPADPNGSGASTFQYTVPEGIQPGEYTIAWTWVNKIGNREFYMNCGPATITAAKKKRYAPAGVSLVRKQTSFPDMFVANLADVNSCVTTEGSDYNYPNPGDAVQSAGTGPYTQLSCGAAAGNNAPAAPTPAASAPAGTSPIAASAPAAQSSAAGGFASGAAGASAATNAPTAPTGSAAPQNPGGVFAGTANPLPSASASAASAPAPAPAANTPAASPAAPASTGTSSSAGQQTPGSACSTEGQWSCLGTSYQRCASGVWSPVMQMATGTTCTPGLSMGLWSRSFSA